jgi:hypothetical protein
MSKNMVRILRGVGAAECGAVWGWRGFSQEKPTPNLRQRRKLAGVQISEFGNPLRVEETKTPSKNNDLGEELV